MDFPHADIPHDVIVRARAARAAQNGNTRQAPAPTNRQRTWGVAGLTDLHQPEGSELAPRLSVTASTRQPCRNPRPWMTEYTPPSIGRTQSPRHYPLCEAAFYLDLS